MYGPSDSLVRCHMVEIIGVVTMGALVTLLAWAMGSESDSERRKIISALSGSAFTSSAKMPEQQTRRAA